MQKRACLVVVLFLVGLVHGISQCPTTELSCLAPGANCSIGSQTCQNKYYCNTSNYTCMPSIPIGGNCSNDGDCINNLVGASLCWGGVCSAITLKQKEGQTCTELEQCTTAFYCNSSGICTKFQQKGQSCNNTFAPCITGFACNLGVCVTAYSVKKGGACDSEIIYDSSYVENMVCEPGLFCAGNGTSPIGKCTPGFTSSNVSCDLLNATTCANPYERCVCVIGNANATCTAPRTFTKEASLDYLGFTECVYDYNCIDTDPKCCHCDQCNMFNHEDSSYKDYLNGCYADAFNNCNRPRLTKVGIFIIVAVGLVAVAVIVGVFVFLKKRQNPKYSPIS